MSLRPCSPTNGSQKDMIEMKHTAHTAVLWCQVLPSPDRKQCCACSLASSFISSALSCCVNGLLLAQVYNANSFTVCKSSCLFDLKHCPASTFQPAETYNMTALTAPKESQACSCMRCSLVTTASLAFVYLSWHRLTPDT